MGLPLLFARTPIAFDMPLTDNVLELVFSFLLDSKPSNPNDDRFDVARPTCRLLATRRARGFEHVKMELLKRGLEWALYTKHQWMYRADRAEENLRYEREKYCVPQPALRSRPRSHERDSR